MSSSPTLHTCYVENKRIDLSWIAIFGLKGKLQVQCAINISCLVDWYGSDVSIQS